MQATETAGVPSKTPSRIRMMFCVLSGVGFGAWCAPFVFRHGAPSYALTATHLLFSSVPIALGVVEYRLGHLPRGSFRRAAYVLLVFASVFVPFQLLGLDSLLKVSDSYRLLGVSIGGLMLIWAFFSVFAWIPIAILLSRAEGKGVWLIRYLPALFGILVAERTFRFMLSV